ncbi:hypothetical protein [Nocardia asteroides]|uniref:hypothetical protein n=1 Tax=Nocardia asteroides TaxID=1824 RepID=UPI001E61E0D6|nr:hypothetical protein [Nocardia asteroides]UGT61612.1 hypothetical protein LTT61_31640 [Nocardia asteroides]
MAPTDQTRTGSQAVERAIHQLNRFDHDEARTAPVPRTKGADVSSRTALIRRRAVDLMRTPHGTCRR